MERDGRNRREDLIKLGKDGFIKLSKDGDREDDLAAAVGMANGCLISTIIWVAILGFMWLATR